MALPTAWLLGLPPDLVASAAVGSAIGLFITPDMDISQPTYPEYIARKIPVAGALFQISSVPYGLMFRHRGMSHNPILGTLSRIIYVAAVGLFWLIWLLGLASLITPGFEPNFSLQWGDGMWSYIAFAILGWWLQDLLHLLADWL